MGLELAAGGAEVAAAAEVLGDGGGGVAGGLAARADAQPGDAGLILGFVEEEGDLGGGDGAGDVDGILDFALGHAGAAEVSGGQADEGHLAAEPGAQRIVGLALEEHGPFAGIEVEPVVEVRGVETAGEEFGGGLEGARAGAGVGEAPGVGDERDPEGLGRLAVESPLEALGKAVDQLAGAAGRGDNPAGNAEGAVGRGVMVDIEDRELGHRVAQRPLGQTLQAAAIEHQGAVVILGADVGGSDARRGVVEQELGWPHTDGREGDGGLKSLRLEQARHRHRGAHRVPIRAHMRGHEDLSEGREGLGHLPNRAA